jgi:alkylated DNA repair dioxygenase AlkB
MPDADVTLYEGQSSPVFGSDYLTALMEEVEWRSETIRVYGKTYLQPRLLEFYGDDGIGYVYSRKRYEAKPWTSLLARTSGG